MTGPFQYPDYNAQYGTTSPIAQSEWSTMLQRRQELADSIMARLNLANQLKAPTDVADAVYNQHQLTGQNQDGTPTDYQRASAPPMPHEMNALLGAAQFYGIANADQIPPQRLKQIVEQRRISMQGERGDATAGEKAQESSVEFLGALGLGTAGELIGLAQRLPFIGDAFARSNARNEAEQWLGRMNENVTAGMPSADVTGYHIASKLGGMLGYALPATAAWKAAGLIGAIPTVGRIGEAIGIVSPIVRAGIQGMAATAMLETGGDQSNQEKMFKVALGGAIPMAAESILRAAPVAFEKIRSFFPAKSDPFYNAQPATPPGTEDADWYFEADHQLGAPPRQIGPTSGPPGSPPRTPPPPGFDTPPETGQLPSGPTINWTGGPKASNAFVPPEGQSDPSIRMGSVEPPTGPAPAAEQPQQPGMPQQPAALLMSPERAALQSRIDGLTEQRDVARRMMETDPLTGLGNKAALARVRETVDADPSLGWVVFDGKKFKVVNDTFGHDAGDQALMNFGRAIQQTAQEMGIPARAFRHGGDEFAAIVPAESMDAFAQRASDLSRQRITPLTAPGIDQVPYHPGVETRLDAYASQTFGEADLSLVANKRVARGDVPAVEQPATGLGQPVPQPVIPAPIEPANLNAADAAVEGATLTKHASLMEGDLAGVAEASKLDDSDVALHAVYQNPGRINVVQGVGDVGSTIRQLVQVQQEGRVMPHHFRVVDREGRSDLLISDGLPVTNKRVSQYKETGMFEGQNATVNGKQVTVTQPAGPGGIVTVSDNGIDYMVPHELVMPGRSSEHGTVDGGEELYQRFQSYVKDQMESGKQQLGADINTDWMSPETSSQLPHMLDKFLDETVGQAPRSRAAIEAYFNTRRVQDFQQLAPQELGELAQANEELASEVRSSPPVQVPIDDIAASKGFAWVNDDQSNTGMLIDKLSDLRVPADSPEAAFNFLRSFNREVPDYTPISDVPIEVMGSNPHASNPGDDLEPVFQGGADTHTSLLNDRLDQLNSDLDALGVERPPVAPPSGGGGAGSPPPPPIEPALTGGGQPALPPGQRTLGAAFAQARAERPRDLYKIVQSLDSAWLNYAVPFRSLTIDLQKQLQNIGIDEADLWRGYSDVVTGVSQAHNEAHPWHAEAADIFSNFRRKLLRGGTVTRIQEISDYNQKIDAMVKAGYKPSEMAAQNRLADYNDRFFNYLINDGSFTLDRSRYVWGYMSRVRMRQGMPGIADPFADKDGMLPQEFKFFAEMARDGNLQFRQMDARTLTTTMVRAAMFKKHVAPSFDGMVQAWDDPRIPTELRSLVTDWLKTVKTGHNPQYDVAVQGARHFLGKMGIPLTNGEVATIYNSAFSNMYRGALGNRPDAVFRDSIQPWLAGTRIGLAPVADAYRRFLGGEAGDMYRRGVEGGWIERGQVRVPNADVFEHEITDPQGTSLLSDKENARREIMAKIGDMAWKLTPRRLRGGIQGTGLDPLLFYQKLGELNRMISGDAGWQVASKALANYQYGMGQLARGEVNLDSGQMMVDKMDELMNTLMKESKARVYPSPIRDEFAKRVANSDFEGAANLLANESANSQFRYGAKENPIGIRKAGMFGRMGMMFGSFTQQYVAGMTEQFANDVPASERVAMALRHALVLTTLGSASAYTGWNFSKWMWHQSLAFAGGPLATGLYNAFEAGSGAIAGSMGQTLTPGQAQAMQSYANTSVGDVAANLASTFNPYASTFRTAENIQQAASSINPVEATARAVVTGERGLSSDFQQYFGSQQTVTPESVQAAINGNPDARAQFSPDEQRFMDSLRRVPRNQQFQAFMSYRNAGANDYNSNVISRGGYIPGFPHGQPSVLQQGQPAFPGTPQIAPYNPADSSRPGFMHYNKEGHPVYNSLNKDPDGRVPTHRLDVPSGKGPNESWEQYESRVLHRDPSTFPATVNQVTNDPNQLVPEVRDSLMKMMSAAAQQGIQLHIAETYRPQEREEYLFQQGRSRPGPRVNWTLTSDHTTHRAADLVSDSNAGYSWIQQNAAGFGFNTVSGDPGHVSMQGAGPAGASPGMLGGGSGGLQ